MFKEVFGNPVTTWLSVAGLIIFFVVFLFILLWTLTRPKSQVNEWSRLPMSPDDAGIDSRE